MTFQLFYYSQLTFDNSAKPIQREKKSDIGITGSVQFSRSVVSDSLPPHRLQHALSSTVSWSLLKLMSIELVMPSNHLILCRPLSSCLQSFPTSGSFLMSALGMSPKYRSFSFSISPFSYPLGNAT